MEQKETAKYLVATMEALNKGIKDAFASAGTFALTNWIDQGTFLFRQLPSPPSPSTSSLTQPSSHRHHNYLFTTIKFIYFWQVAFSLTSFLGVAVLMLWYGGLIAMDDDSRLTVGNRIFSFTFGILLFLPNDLSDHIPIVLEHDQQQLQRRIERIERIYACRWCCNESAQPNGQHARYPPSHFHH